MKLRLNVLAGLLFGLSAAVHADDITIGDVTFVAGQTVDVDVELTNPDKSYTGFQCDVYLPDGVSLESYAASARLASQHVLSIALNSGGFYRILVYSMPATAVSGTSGAVVTLTLKTDDTADTGATTVDVKNKKFRDSDGGNNNFEETSSTATIVVNATVAASGYGSFSWPRALDFSGCAGLTAVYAGELEQSGSSSKNSNLQLNEIADWKVPANTGVLLYGTPGTYNPETIDDSEASLTVGNSLSETASGAYTVSSDDIYAMATKSGKTGFYRVKQGVTIPQYKAYLVDASGVSARDAFFFGDETTGIDGVNAADAQSHYYTVSGVRVETPVRKGVYISNGKKMVVK